MMIGSPSELECQRDAGNCPTRKLSDKTQPNDTRICRRTSVSDKFRVGQSPPSDASPCSPRLSLREIC